MILNFQVCAFSIQIQMVQYFGAALLRKVRPQLCLKYEVLGHYLCVARLEIKGKKELLAKRYPCMSRDTCGHRGSAWHDLSGCVLDTRAALGCSPASCPHLGQQGRWSLLSFGGSSEAATKDHPCFQGQQGAPSTQTGT